MHFLLGPATVALAVPLYENRKLVVASILPMLTCSALFSRTRSSCNEPMPINSPLAEIMLARMQRLDLRHRRESGTTVHKRPVRRARDEDDEGVFVCGAAWA